MKSKTILIVVFSFVALAAVLFFFFSKKAFLPSPAPSEGFSPGVKTEGIKDFSIGTFPQERKPVEVSIQGAKGQKTIQLSWDSSELSMFHLILFDAELFRAQAETMVLWGTSSLKELSPSITKDEVPGFIPSGYVAGEIIPGFTHFPDISNGIQLTQGKEYFIQVNGFTKENELITVNKEFTFTTSCLPPNCE